MLLGGGGQTTRSCQLRHTAFWLNSFAASSICLPCGCFSFFLADGQSESVHNETVNDNNTTINNNTVMWTAGQTQKEHGGVVVSKSVAGKKNLKKAVSGVGEGSLTAVVALVWTAEGEEFLNERKMAMQNNNLFRIE